MSHRVVADYSVVTRLSDNDLERLLFLVKKYGLDNVKRVAESFMRENKSFTVYDLERELRKLKP